MGKQGPCCHCGVTSTPLWRNGPPDKPVLCNACGSRWRTKGTLANYTPLHARSDPDFEDQGISRANFPPVYKKKEVKFHKRKREIDNGRVEVDFLDHYHRFSGVIDEDTSNRSSSGSAVSNSESSEQFTGPARSVVWDRTVLSRKRTCTDRQKPNSVEKLTQDLYAILHKQESFFSGSSEEDVLFEAGKSLVSAEIVHGSVLINPSSIAREEESEASSLSIENKQYSRNESYSYPPANRMAKCLEPVKRDSFQQEQPQTRENRDSPRCDIDFSDVLNYEEFMRQLINEEQHELVKYVPPVDAAKLVDGPNRMFESSRLSRSINPVRSEHCQNKKIQESSTTMKSSKGMMMNMKSSFKNKEYLPPATGGSCFVLENSNLVEESSDWDVLFDVRSNTSFPQAELLYPPFN